MKRLAAALMMLALACSAGRVSRAETRQTGDLDGDGAVCAADAAKVLRAASGAESLDAAASALADATGNMEVGGADAQAILLLATGGIRAFSDLAVRSERSLLGERHLKRFSYLGTILKNDNYRSDQVGVYLSRGAYGDFAYVLADIYVQSVESMRTAFGGGGFLAGKALTRELAADNGAILAINGDGYSGRGAGLLVRNGVWYRENAVNEGDICVLYRDGRLVTCDAGGISADEIRAGDAYQSWTGGPGLLDETGGALTRFNCPQSLYAHAARTVIGYYEPGHYCFVVVDGPLNPDSDGAELPELAQFMASLGCKAAYCLAGGNSSVMATQTKVLSTAKNGGRVTSDIVYLCEPVGESGGA